MRRLSFLAVLALSLFAQPVRLWADTAPAAETLSVDSSQSSLSYQIVHKLHTVKATSKKPVGKGRILPDGKAQVMITVPVESFDSGNSNRDVHMKETVEAARFPSVELKALGEGVTAPASYPATVKKTFRGELSFHGIKKQVEVPATLTFESAGQVRVVTSFKISLDEFKVERPSLLFVKVDDACQIDVNLLFKK